MQILQKGFDHGQAPSLAINFFGLLDAPKFESCLATRLCGPHPGTDVRCGMHLDVTLNFAQQVAAALFVTEHAAQPDSAARSDRIQLSLFMTERDHGIHLGGAPCRNVAGGQSAGNNDRGRPHERKRIGRLHAEEKSRDQPGQRHRAE